MSVATLLESLCFADLRQNVLLGMISLDELMGQSAKDKQVTKLVQFIAALCPVGVVFSVCCEVCNVRSCTQTIMCL